MLQKQKLTLNLLKRLIITKNVKKLVLRENIDMLIIFHMPPLEAIYFYWGLCEFSSKKDLSPLNDFILSYLGN